MRYSSTIAVAVCVMLAAATVPSAQQAGALQTAATTLGTATIKTLQIEGSGANFSVGQNYSPADPWPRVTVKSYVATIDYDSASMRQELLREMGAAMPRGGGAPFFGEQRQIQVVSGDAAWNVPAPAPAAAGAPAPQAPPAQPAPGNQVERMLVLWSTPQGFVKAAMANNATTRSARGGTEVSFTLAGKYKMTGTINAQGQVEKVQTWMDNPVVGDMLVETTYSGYKDFSGVTFPSRIVQAQDGFPSLDLTITKVTPNPPVAIAVPDNLRNAAPAPITVNAQKMGDGVYYLTGGTHHSTVVEMRDHIVVVDLPVNQARAQAVLAKAKEVVPNKPIRYVVTSHHHWDHLGGIREAMAEGATIVTHESNKRFLERVARAPHTLGPDRQAQVKNGVKIQTVGDMGRLTDGTRTVELHLVKGFEHTADLLLVYVPELKLLAEPDAYTPPGQPGTPLIPPAVVNAKALLENIQRLKLDVQVIAPFHGNRTSDMAELTRLAGTATTSN